MMYHCWIWIRVTRKEIANFELAIFLCYYHPLSIELVGVGKGFLFHVNLTPFCIGICLAVPIRQRVPILVAITVSSSMSKQKVQGQFCGAKAFKRFRVGCPPAWLPLTGKTK